jgi:hypothetical protein
MSQDDGSEQPSTGTGQVSDKKGTVSPYSVTRPGSGPSPPNQPENRGGDSTLQPGRYEVFSGQSVPVGAKPATTGPRVVDEGADPNGTALLQGDPAQMSRRLSPASIPGFKIVKKGQDQ